MTSGSAAAALARLKGDQAFRSIAADRAGLAALGMRLDMAARASLTRDLVTKVRTDRRFAPVLQGLMRLALSR